MNYLIVLLFGLCFRRAMFTVLCYLCFCVVLFLLSAILLLIQHLNKQEVNLKFV